MQRSRRAGRLFQGCGIGIETAGDEEEGSFPVQIHGLLFSCTVAWKQIIGTQWPSLAAHFSPWAYLGHRAQLVAEVLSPEHVQPDSSADGKQQFLRVFARWVVEQW